MTHANGDFNIPSSSEERRIDAAFNEVLRLYLASNHRRKVEKIQRAFRFARQAYEGARLRNGDPYILHPLAVAKIVVGELGLGSTSICAAMLHDVLEVEDITFEDVQAACGKQIASIVAGLNKISGGVFRGDISARAESFRRLLLSMSSDVRVVLIKMADRLNNLRRIDRLRPSKQSLISGETMHLYAPLADRLGLYKIKTEMEDLTFRFNNPDIYENIRSKVMQSEEDRLRIVEELVGPIRSKLDAAGFRYEIKARTKSTFSIYNKMRRKGVPFEEVYDVYAVRVIFENDDDAQERLRCWQIYTFFTDGRMVHPDRLRDWTSMPKANGYRALHLTVMGPEGRWVEVQIRSRKMDDIAELGYAAHWKYKEGIAGQSEMDAWMNTLKDILAHPGPDAIDFLDTIKLNLYSSEIFLFTPKGDLITLPSGSTVLDMAFAIHSDLGLHCVAGKIDHRLVPPDHVLGSADQVEIITSKYTAPTEAWLGLCHSAKAHHKIRAFLRRNSPKGISRTARQITELTDSNE